MLLQVAEDEIWLSIADSDIKLWAAGIAGARGMDVQVFDDVSPLAIQAKSSGCFDLCGEWIRHLRYFASLIRLTAFHWSLRVPAGRSRVMSLSSGRKPRRGIVALVAEAGAIGIGPETPNYIERVESGLISYGADNDDAATRSSLGSGGSWTSIRATLAGKTALHGIRESGDAAVHGAVDRREPFQGTNESPWQLSWDGGKFAGFATASAYWPRAKSNIAVAMVNIEPIEAGAPVLVHTGGPVLPAALSSCLL